MVLGLQRPAPLLPAPLWLRPCPRPRRSRDLSGQLPPAKGSRLTATAPAAPKGRSKEDPVRGDEGLTRPEQPGRRPCAPDSPGSAGNGGTAPPPLAHRGGRRLPPSERHSPAPPVLPAMLPCHCPSAAGLLLTPSSWAHSATSTRRGAAPASLEPAACTPPPQARARDRPPTGWEARGRAEPPCIKVTGLRNPQSQAPEDRPVRIGTTV